MATRDEKVRQRVGQAQQTAPPLRIETKYVRSNLCRVIHADGAWGGVTSRLYIHMGLFSERNVSPESGTYVLDPKEHVAREEVKGLPKQQILRETEADVIMSVETARALRDWLTERLAVADQIAADPEAAFTTRTTSTEKRP